MDKIYDQLKERRIGKEDLLGEGVERFASSCMELLSLCQRKKWKSNSSPKNPFSAKFEHQQSLFVQECDIVRP